VSRERGPNVLDVTCNADEIAAGIKTQLLQASYPQSTIYGDGNAAQKITDTIAELDPELKPPMTPDLLGYHEE
jgi:hypothetical protein